MMVSITRDDTASFEGIIMSDPRLVRRLDQVASRLRTLRGLWAAAVGWSLLAILIFLFRQSGQNSWAWCAVLFGVPSILIAAVLASSRRRSDLHAAAVLIEKKYPQLDSRLLTAIEQQPRGSNWDFSFLQSELLSEVFAQLRKQDWHRAVTGSRLWLAHGVHALTLFVCLLLLVPLLKTIHGQDGLARTPGSQPNSIFATSDWVVLVEPGNTEIERGTSLLVLARFPEQLPGQVELVTVDPQGREVRHPMQKSLDDPLFGGRVAHVAENLTYRVEYDGIQSDDFVVTTFDYPALVQADADLTFPSYTSLEPRTIQDFRRITVVEGTALDLKCQLNKPVTSARLIGADATTQELTSDSSKGNLRSAHWTLSSPGEQTFQLQLVDDAGRTNRDPTEFLITVVPNRTPDLKVSFPTKDLRVSPLQELVLKAQASDDFGVRNFGMILQTPSGSQETVDFTGTTATQELAQAEYLLAMEKFQVQPDDLFSYYFYADDVGPDGQLRRSFSDIYFAEVRPFEEIYRQLTADSRSQGSGECKKLIELQRQVVAASWNVVRKEPADAVSNRFASEVKTIRDSQSQIQKFTETLKSRLSDPLMQKHAGEAIEQMGMALESFNRALDPAAVAPVSEGRTSAQSAYQTLLKLQARETHLKQNQGASDRPGAPRNEMNQQLNALKLKNDRDRYETERQAKAAKTAADREVVKALDRLKELARRQEDLNNRIRELQNSLREDVSEEQRQSIERQLQRLQQDQEELLHHLDEVREQMNSEPIRQRMPEAREQADVTRERLVQSAQALKEGQTSRAITEGTRAQRQLNEMQQNLRQQMSGQFDSAMQTLRDDVRKLARKEQELAEKLQQEPGRKGPSQKTLGDPALPEGNALADEFRQQQQDLRDILERSQEIVRESETSEPLLSKNLYETLRGIRKYQPEEALENVVQLTQRGIRSSVPEIEQQARKGIEELQAGVEAATESILGNEEASLRYAQAELNELTAAIQKELAQHDPSSGQVEASPSKENGNSSEASPAQASGQKPMDNAGNQSAGQGQSSADANGGQQRAGTSGQSSSSAPSQGQRGSRANGKGEGAPSSEAINRLLGLGGSQGGMGSGPEEGPLTGTSYTEWSQRLQNLEEALTTAELRAQAAAIRDRVRQERISIKRHSKAPDWEVVRASIYGPLLELEKDIAEELARRDPQRQLVPVDRDPVPEKYTDFVRSYFEELSRQKTDN
ncbi:hypothetical protein SH661x_004581 [Planctomicrobium sp. SH661]|uniref:hypothetical protein n=1 Tax=Planctomicrobium sp. SH661 TaxID=3448124 RepID=UPI003F5C8B08